MMRKLWQSLNNYISGIDFPLTLSAFILLLLKACVFGVTWPEMIGFPLLLALHYGRDFLPRRMKTTINLEEFEKTKKDLEMLNKEIMKLKLAVGFKSLNPMRSQESVGAGR